MHLHKNTLLLVLFCAFLWTCDNGNDEDQVQEMGKRQDLGKEDATVVALRKSLHGQHKVKIHVLLRWAGTGASSAKPFDTTYYNIPLYVGKDAEKRDTLYYELANVRLPVLRQKDTFVLRQRISAFYRRNDSLLYEFDRVSLLSKQLLDKQTKASNIGEAKEVKGLKHKLPLRFDIPDSHFKATYELLLRRFDLRTLPLHLTVSIEPST